MREIKRKTTELYQRVQGFKTEVQEMYQEAQRKITPIR
jgi:hypothetical protein